jgi:D-arabinose 1-dehydrogenase-like Zn-dependent alcohol dehydrogenase
MGGRVSLIGILTGGGEINPLPVLRKAVSLQGIFVGSREMFEDMNRAMDLNHTRPVIDRVFPFEEAREAYRYLESGRISVRFVSACEQARPMLAIPRPRRCICCPLRTADSVGVKAPRLLCGFR